MKVLLSAIACHPHLGSESKVGWDAARAISEIPMVQECHVMTHTVNREAIVKEQTSGHAPRVRFHFFGGPFRYHPNRMLARLQSWLIYRDWQLKSVVRATELHRQHNFTLTHHVTYASWRIPPLLWQLPIPFVFGPVGGGTKTPQAFRSIFGSTGRAFEFLRETATFFSERSRNLKLCCANSSAAVAADAATADFLSSHGATDVRQLCQVFFTLDEASRFTSPRNHKHSKSKELTIFAGGNLEARKGTLLSLRALATLKNRGVPFSYTYGGGGPDLRAMKNLVTQLGLGQQVCFHEGYSGLEYIERLINSDVYLLPSVRETAGITMMEAMLAGCYPVVLAGTGAGDIVEQAGGAALRVDSPEEAIPKIADRLEWCYNNGENMRQQAEIAGNNIQLLFSEKAYQNFIADIYMESCTNHLSNKLLS